MENDDRPQTAARRPGQHARLFPRGGSAGGDDGAEDGEWATETQRELAAIWREMGLLVFKGGGTEFYAAGGDSLRLVSSWCASESASRRA